jgi:hypothetical protein
MNFPSKIPVILPWISSESVPKTVGELTSDEGFLQFMEAWRRELRSSEREKNYLKFITAQSGLRESDKLTVGTLRQILRKAMDLVAGRSARVSHPVAAFELLVIVEGVAEVALTSLRNSARKELERELIGVQGSVVIFAFQAVTHHFRASAELAGN